MFLALLPVLVLQGCSDDKGEAIRDAAADAAFDSPGENIADAADAGEDRKISDGPDSSGSDLVTTDGPEDARSCQSGQIARYNSPGCGAQAPATMCGYSAMDGCYGGWLCLCDGTVMPICESWSAKPWAYRVSTAGSPPATCDPSAAPDGGLAGDGPAGSQ